MPLAAIGYLDGTLAIYDLATQTLRHKCQHEVMEHIVITRVHTRKEHITLRHSGTEAHYHLQAASHNFLSAI